MFWSSIRSIRPIALVALTSSAATALSWWSASWSSSISRLATTALNGTRMSWLSSAASCDISVAAVWRTSGEVVRTREDCSNRSSISLVTLRACPNR